MKLPNRVKLIVLACSKTKGTERTSAIDLYQGQLFRKAVDYKQHFYTGSISVILSAQHHVLKTYEQVDPYNLALKDMTKAEREAWADVAGEQLGRFADSVGTTDIVAYCGKDYMAAVHKAVPYIRRFKELHTPVKGMGIGEQLSFFTKRDPRDVVRVW